MPLPFQPSAFACISLVTGEPIKAPPEQLGPEAQERQKNKLGQTGLALRKLEDLINEDIS